jgi:hypothetical protein
MSFGVAQWLDLTPRRRRVRVHRNRSDERSLPPSFAGAASVARARTLSVRMPIMKPMWLFRVFDAFNVRGNGWVLLPGVKRDGPQVQVGDAVELRGGKAPARTATVKGVGAFAPRSEDADAMPLLVELDPTERPLIINAEVWWVPADRS